MSTKKLLLAVVFLLLAGTLDAEENTLPPPRVTMGQPCSTVTDIEEGTCEMRDVIVRQHGVLVYK